jgi:20S proteasome alpha/beta subunit
MYKIICSLAFQKNFDHSRGVRDRPFGTSVLLAAYDDSGPQLYVVEPSGNCHVRDHLSVRTLMQ